MNYQQEINIKELEARCRLLYKAAEALDWLHEAGVIPSAYFEAAETELWRVRMVADELLSGLQLEEELT